MSENVAKMATRQHRLPASWSISHVLPWRTLPVVAALGLASLAGCGPRSNRLEVTGSIALDGAPLDQGSIRFTSTSGETLVASGAMIRDGQFAVPQKKGLTPGTYLVEISAPDRSGKLVIQPSAPGEPRLPPTALERIPAEYNTNSKQTIEVSADGENHFEFNIQSRAAK